MVMARFSRFLRRDDGAVTVDWVVLTAAVVGLGVASVAAVRLGVVSLGSDIGSGLSSASVVSLGTLGNAPAACDWVCAYSAFLWAEEPNFTEEEFGMTVEEMAQARLDEFNGYTSQFLRDHVASLAGHQAQPEPYRSYYAAEIEAIRGILESRGESL